MLDAAGRPYFLWDTDMTLERFEEQLASGDPEVRAHLIGKLMRQAKPDDVFQFVGLEDIRQLWSQLQHRLGRTREFWSWWMQRWEVAVVGLVDEPVPAIEEPQERTPGRETIRVDTQHEILVNKLCALVQRSELRDLVNVYELLSHGEDLRRGLTDAPKKDTGFSPLTLAWLLKDLSIEAIGRAEGWPEDRITEIVRFREEAIANLGDLSRPEGS